MCAGSGDDDRAVLLDVTAIMLGLALAPEWRDEVLIQMKVLGAAAELVLEFPLEDEALPGPIFLP